MARIFPKRERIYILPTGQGVIFLLFLVAMIFMGAIYSSQLVNLLGFLLLTIYALAMVATHQNLSKMREPKLVFLPNFSNEPSVLTLQYESPTPEERLGLRLRWWDGKTWSAYQGLQTLRGPAGSRALTLGAKFSRRGVYHISRFQLETSAPFGLFRAWRTEQMNQEFVIYPSRRLLLDQHTSREQDPINADEWEDPIPLEVNDWARRLDWRRWAKTDRPWTRPWVGSREDLAELDWRHFIAIPVEDRLSHFTAALADASGSGQILSVIGPWGKREIRTPYEAHKMFEIFGRWTDST